MLVVPSGYHQFGAMELPPWIGIDSLRTVLHLLASLTLKNVEIPNCSATFSFAARDANHLSDIRGSLDSKNLWAEAEFQFRHLRAGTCSNFMSTVSL